MHSSDKCQQVPRILEWCNSMAANIDRGEIRKYQYRGEEGK